jgi:hypothetical protein
MKIGDVVRNVSAVRTNPAVHDHPVEAGFLGIVVGVKQTDLNAAYREDGKGDVYVDVILSVDGEGIRCGNYLAGTFEVIV